MLSNVTRLYENCGATQITLHSISNPNLNRIASQYRALRKNAFELENEEALLPWVTFIRKLLFAWSYSPLALKIKDIDAIESDYDQLTELWKQRKNNFQESIRIKMDDILDGINDIRYPEISLRRAHSKLSDLKFDKTYVCQKNWGWGIDNDQLSVSAGIRRLTHVSASADLGQRACFFGSPRLYALKGLSGIWTAPRFKEIHFIIHDYTGLNIPSWKSDSINFENQSKSNSPWNCQIINNELITAPTLIPIKEELETDELVISDFIKNLNRQSGSGSDEDEVFCVLLLSETEKVIPIRQQSKPDCLILGAEITYKSTEAEEISSGDIILIRSSSGNTLKEIESNEHSAEWDIALSLHNEWKELLLQLIDTGLISEIKESVNQTPQSIRNWSKPENHGPERKETFIALMAYLGFNKDAEQRWKTIQALRGIGHSIGTDATETLKNNFLNLDTSEQRRLSKDGILKKYLGGDSEAAAMTAIRISDVLTYSAKIRPSLINQVLTPSNIPWL